MQILNPHAEFSITFKCKYDFLNDLSPPDLDFRWNFSMWRHLSLQRGEGLESMYMCTYLILFLLNGLMIDTTNSVETDYTPKEGSFIKTISFNNLHLATEAGWLSLKVLFQPHVFPKKKLFFKNTILKIWYIIRVHFSCVRHLYLYLVLVWL